MIPFQFQDVAMNNDSQIDHNGAMWFVVETDYFDMPEFRQTVIDRSLGHGAVMARSNLGRRIIRFSGVCRVKGVEGNIWKSRERLLAQLSTFTGPKLLVVDEYGIEKTMTYWGTGAPSITIAPGGFSFEFSILCEDPRKYGYDFVFGASNIASGSNQNFRTQGSFVSTPILIISGIPSSAGATNTITISNTFGGSSLGTMSIASFVSSAGETSLTMNVAARTLVSNLGINRYGAISPSTNTWPELQPEGPNTLAFTGSGYNMNVAYKDTWL